MATPIDFSGIRATSLRSVRPSRLSRLLSAARFGRHVHVTGSTADVALCVTTYQRPWHLRRTLASIAAQQGVAGRFELVVTDDGSLDETPGLVEQFARSVTFRVNYTTHEHSVFHPARSRNEGTRATTAPYLLFIDGDCVLPPDHVAIHLGARRKGRSMFGDSLRVEQGLSQSLTEEGAARGEFIRWNLPAERHRLRHKHYSALYFSFVRHRNKPRLISNNFGVWRADLERVNGFDENYRGWGQEDDDLGRRLRWAGVRPASILGRTRLYHLWHPREPSATSDWRGGPNVSYYFRRGWLVRCRNGLVKRPLSDLAITIVGQTTEPAKALELWRECNLPSEGWNSPLELSAGNQSPEVELLFLPGRGHFSGRAQCNVLVVLDDSPVPDRLLDPKTTHRLVANRKVAGISAHYQFPLAELRAALDSIT